MKKRLKKVIKLLYLYLVIIMLGLAGTGITGGIYYATSQLDLGTIDQGYVFHSTVRAIKQLFK